MKVKHYALELLKNKWKNNLYPSSNQNESEIWIKQTDDIKNLRLKDLLLLFTTSILIPVTIEIRSWKPTPTRNNKETSFWWCSKYYEHQPSSLTENDDDNDDATILSNQTDEEIQAKKPAFVGKNKKERTTHPFPAERNISLKTREI